MGSLSCRCGKLSARMRTEQRLPSSAHATLRDQLTEMAHALSGEFGKRQCLHATVSDEAQSQAER